MFKSSKLLWIICLCFSSPMDAAERKAITEERALELLELSLAAQSLRLEMDRGQADAHRVGLWPNPDFVYLRESSLGATDQFFTIEQRLPITGRLGFEGESAAARAEAIVKRTQLGLVSLRADVRAAFCDLVWAQEQSTRLAEGRRRMLELVRILRAREQGGESSGFDRMRAERELAEVEVDLLEAELEESRARSFLKGLLAVEEDTELWAEGRLDVTDEDLDLDELLARATSRGDVMALEHERQSAELRGRAASRVWIPEPSILAGVKTTTATGTSGQGATFSLAVPLPVFDRGQRDGALNKVEELLSRSRYGAQLRMARAEIELAHEQVVRRREAEALYRRSADPDMLVRIALLAYDEGEQGILELLDAYRTALSVQLRRLTLAAEARKARIELDRVVGEEVMP